jgi:hypothetical protein
VPQPREWHTDGEEKQQTSCLELRKFRHAPVQQSCTLETYDPQVDSTHKSYFEDPIYPTTHPREPKDPTQ